MKHSDRYLAAFLFFSLTLVLRAYRRRCWCGNFNEESLLKCQVCSMSKYTCENIFGFLYIIIYVLMNYVFICLCECYICV